MTSSTTTSATTHTLEVPGALLTYDVRRNDGSDEPVLLLIGSPMGAAGFGTLAGLLRRPHGRDLRPARRRAQPAHRRRGRPRRPRSTRTTCTGIIAAARRRTGRPVRQQRRRGQRARARRPPPGGGAHARRARAAGRRPGARLPSTRWPRAATSTRPTSATAWARPWPSSSPSSATRARSRPTTSTQPAPDPAMFGLPTEDDGSRDDVLLGQNMRVLHALRARRRGAPRGVDPHRRRGRCRVRGRAGPPRRRRPSPSGSGRRRSSSRATTADSSAASTARTVSPRPSPPASARSSAGVAGHRSRSRCTPSTRKSTYWSSVQPRRCIRAGWRPRPARGAGVRAARLIRGLRAGRARAALRHRRPWRRARRAGTVTSGPARSWARGAGAPGAPRRPTRT